MAEVLYPPKHGQAKGVSLLHQTLHGYAEGHRLLESSLPLADEAARLVLRMSDLSGSSIRPGFDEYLTGYPVESMGLYALARTWWAKEMPRPGCVWTHTLLLPSDALSADELSTLLDEFQRPTSDRSLYSEPLRWDASRAESPDARLDGSLLSWLIDNFYFNSSDPLLIPCLDSEEYERTILRFWSQQWPGLRKSFTFCTGSLSARKLSDTFLQVQCVPVRATREIQLEIDSKKGSYPTQIFSSEPSAPPRSPATKDCFELGGGRFRKFLWAAAKDGARREDYAGFYRIYELLEESPDVGSVLSLVAKEFPVQDEAPGVKDILFGEPSKRLAFSETSEATMLAVLGSSGESHAIDPKRLHLKERAESLSTDFSAARTLIGGVYQSPLTPIGLEILSGFLSDLNSAVAREITQTEPRFLSTLVRAKPGLATSASLWTVTGDRRSLLEALIDETDLNDETVEGITAALLESGTDDLIGWAINYWGAPAICGALNWMVTKGGHLPGQCLDALTFRTQEVRDWVDKEPEKPLFALYVAAKILAPYTEQICQRDTSVWNRALVEALGRIEEGEAIRFITFMLALGLRNAPPQPLELIGACFEIVHEAEAKERLPNDAWRYLEPVVPSAFMYWDKCERMRRGLAAAFVAFNWPQEELRQVIKSRWLQNEILDSAKNVTGGKAYFKGHK